MSGLSTIDDLKGLIEGTKFTLPGGTVWETTHEYPGIIMVSLVEPHGCDHLTLLATPDWAGEEELHVYLEHSETGVRPEIEDGFFKDLFADDPDVDVGRWQMAVLGYLKKHEAEILAHCGGARPAASGALDAVNRHRRKMGQRELDPAAAGWSPQDVEIEAARIAKLNPSTFRAIYDGRRRGKDMVLILPMSQWGGRPYGLGRDHDYRLDTREPRVGQEVGLTLGDDSYRRLVAARNHRQKHRGRRRNGKKKQGSLFSVEEEGFALTHPKGTHERVQIPRETQDPLFEPEKPDREKMEELRERELAERAARKRKRKGKCKNPDLESLKRRLMR